jgi:hypothetical protein
MLRDDEVLVPRSRLPPLGRSGTKLAGPLGPESPPNHTEIVYLEHLLLLLLVGVKMLLEWM